MKLPPYLDDDVLSFGGMRGHGFCDHFITSTARMDGWDAYGNLALVTPTIGITDDQHPGTLILATGGSSTGWTVTSKGSSCLTAGSNVELFCEALVYIGTLSDATNSFTVRVGWGDNVAGADHNNGMYFEASNGASPVWRAKVSGSGTRTLLGTSTNVATGWTKLGILHTMVSGTRTAVFYINGVQVQTATGVNLPTGETETFAPTMGIYKAAGTSNRAVYMDYYRHRMTFLNPAA